MEEEKIPENKMTIKRPKESDIMRMTAHQYEKKINELLEKIDIFLRLTLVFDFP